MRDPPTLCDGDQLAAVSPGDIRRKSRGVRDEYAKGQRARRKPAAYPRARADAFHCIQRNNLGKDR